MKLESYLDLLNLATRKPTKLNMLRALVYPLVKAAPGLRILIVVVAERSGCVRPFEVRRW
ncbi:MAG: hypothetical protein QXJ97_06070 [Desulfurococcaceae archaeon]